MELDRRGGRTEEADGSRREGTQRQPQNNELQERMTLGRSRLHGEGSGLTGRQEGETWGSSEGAVEWPFPGRDQALTDSGVVPAERTTEKRSWLKERWSRGRRREEGRRGGRGEEGRRWDGDGVWGERREGGGSGGRALRRADDTPAQRQRGAPTAVLAPASWPWGRLAAGAGRGGAKLLSSMPQMLLQHLETSPRRTAAPCPIVKCRPTCCSR